MIRATCSECFETFEAPEQYADLVIEGAAECAERDREQAAALASVDTAVA
jgi:nitroimidazol reductase NimA-like FMN-containing flavoprotein (pyridoxamine 5'-phosphate oxidase superfamily)